MKTRENVVSDVMRGSGHHEKAQLGTRRGAMRIKRAVNLRRRKCGGLIIQLDDDGMRFKERHMMRVTRGGYVFKIKL